MKYTLETDKLILVPFDMPDLDLLHFTFTDPFVRKYLWDNEIISLQQTKEIMSANIAFFDARHWGLWKVLVKNTNTYVGFAGLWYFFDENQPQLLFGLLPAHTKKGYATEAAKAVTAYAFQQLQFPYLTASCDTPNDASKKVCGRLNMIKIEEKQVDGKLITFYRINSHAENLQLPSSTVTQL